MLKIFLFSLAVATAVTGYDWYTYPEFVNVLVGDHPKTWFLFFDVIKDKNTILFIKFVSWFVFPFLALSFLWRAINNPSH